MFEVLAHVATSPLVTLYTCQAVTYIAAAALSVRAGHGDLAAVYSVSALLHCGFASCHMLALA